MAWHVNWLVADWVTLLHYAIELPHHLPYFVFLLPEVLLPFSSSQLVISLISSKVNHGLDGHHQRGFGSNMKIVLAILIFTNMYTSK